MYNHNNKDKTKEDGLQEWYQSLIQTTPHNEDTNPHRRERDIFRGIKELYNSLPTNSTKGTSKYHR